MAGAARTLAMCTPLNLTWTYKKQSYMYIKYMYIYVFLAMRLGT